MSDDYKRAEQENLTNPKNRFLFLFCHAKEVDNSWGCDWSFSTGVIMFSIVIGLSAFFDIYYLAKADVFGNSTTGLKVWFVIKILSDFIAFVGIGMACYAVSKQNLKFSIISYYVIVLSFILNTLFLISCFYYIFTNPKIILLYFIPWGIYEFGLILFCWILFCNQVYLGRKQREQANQTGY